MSPNNYQFREELLQVHLPNRRMDFAKPSAQDVLVTSEWSIVLPASRDTVLTNAAKDLEDYFAVSMNETVTVKEAPVSEKVIEYQIDALLGENKYKVVVTTDHITLIGFDSKSAARAGYFLEDLMNFNEGPFVAIQNTTREYLYSPRMVHSGYGLD